MDAHTHKVIIVFNDEEMFYKKSNTEDKQKSVMAQKNVYIPMLQDDSCSRPQRKVVAEFGVLRAALDNSPRRVIFSFRVARVPSVPGLITPLYARVGSRCARDFQHSARGPSGGRTHSFRLTLAPGPQRASWRSRSIRSIVVSKPG